MEKFVFKFESPRHDEMKRSRKSTACSKMKMERLASVLKNLKDDERQSKLRNEHLLRDFEKVSKLSVDLDTKARKLKRVKQEYEHYISTVYPHWKENVEMSRLRKTKSPSEDLSWGRRDPYLSGQGGAKPLQKQGQRDLHMFPPYSSSRLFDQDPKLNPPTFNFPKSNSSSPYFTHGDSGSFMNEMPDRFVQYAQPKSPRDETLSSVFTDQYHNARYTSNIDRDKGIHESEMPLFESNRALRTANSSVAYPIRPDNLRIPRVKETADISSFTVLPQALALSPDGQLVLLPMAFSTQKSPIKDFTNVAEPPAVNPKRGKSNRNSLGMTFDSIDVTGEMVDKSIGGVSQGPLTSTAKVPLDATKSLSRPDTVNNIANCTINQDMLCDGGSDETQKQSFGIRGVVNERRVNAEEYDNVEREMEGETEKSDTFQMKTDAIPDRQRFIHDDHMANRSFQSKEELPSRSRSNSSRQMNGVFDAVSSRDSNTHSVDTIITTEGSGHISVEPSNVAIREQKKREIAGKVNIESVESLNDTPLSQAEGRKSFDMESNDVDLNELLEKYNSDDVIEEIPFAEKDRVTLDMPQSEFIASREEHYSPEVNSSRFESEEVLEPEELLSEERVKKSMTGLNEVGITSGGKHEGFHSDKMSGNEKNARGSFELYSQDMLKNEMVIETRKTEKKDRPLDMPEISYLFEEIEDRMENVDRNEFYRKSIEDASYETLRRIKETLLSAGSLNEFETSDLCLVSRQSLTEFVGMNSKTGYIIEKDEKLSAIYTLDAFRDILSSNFEELWEYVFNHMELLAANQIFDNSTVCELFSKVLCPGNQTIAFEVSQAIFRIMDVADEGIRYEDDQDFSFADEELTPIESDSSQDNAEQNHEKISSNNQDYVVATKGVVATSEIPSLELIKSNNPQNEELELGPVAHELSRSAPVDKKKSQNEAKKDRDDLLLDLGDLSSDADDNGDNDNDDDGDDDSTFDSAKFSPHRTVDSTGQPRNVENEDVDISEEGTVSERSFVHAAKDISNNLENESENESDENLEDLLSTSLVLESSRSKKDAAGYKKMLPFLEQKQESFEIDEHKDAKKLSEKSGKETVFSPQHSKSISSKFRKPGFWENSDTESEADDLNISAGNKLSNQNASEDEFDFDFYNL